MEMRDYSTLHLDINSSSACMVVETSNCCSMQNEYLSATGEQVAFDEMMSALY